MSMGRRGVSTRRVLSRLRSKRGTPYFFPTASYPAARKARPVSSPHPGALDDGDIPEAMVTQILDGAGQDAGVGGGAGFGGGGHHQVGLEGPPRPRRGFCTLRRRTPSGRGSWRGHWCQRSHRCGSLRQLLFLRGALGTEIGGGQGDEILGGFGQVAIAPVAGRHGPGGMGRQAEAGHVLHPLDVVRRGRWSSSAPSVPWRHWPGCWRSPERGWAFAPPAQTGGR